MIKLLFPLLFLFSCTYNDPEHMKIANRIRSKFKKQIYQKDIEIFGIGGDTREDIHEFYYDLVIYDTPDIDKARRHLVENLEMLIADVNEDLEARPYLREYPFSEKYVHFSIGFWKAPVTSVQPPLIAYASVFNGRVAYSIDDNPAHYTKVARETYAEAYEKVYGRPLPDRRGKEPPAS